MKKTFITTTEEQTESLGKAMADLLPDRVVIRLIGPLGAGKTALVRGLVSAVSSDDVSSPTFVYHQRYQGKIGPVDHVDCYRIHSEPSKLETTGIAELAATVPGWLLVEWPLSELQFPSNVPVIDVTATGAPQFQFSVTAPDSISLPSETVVMR